MAEIFLAVDMGGSYTRIYRKDYGLVLKEPSLIGAVQTENGYDVKLIGEEAKIIQGKTDERTIVFSPISEGQIKSPEYTIVLLKHFLSKVVNAKMPFTKIKCLVPYPTGLNEEQKKVYIDVFKGAGIKDVILIPKAVCTAYGMGLNLFSTSACMVVDLGGVSVDSGVVSMGSLINGSTLGVGGKSIDSQIIKFVKNKYGVEIGIASAQKLKEEIGSLFSNDTANMEITGMDHILKIPANVVVYASDIKECLIPLLDEVDRIVQTMLNSLSPEISSDIIKNGIFIAGGLSNIVGLERYLRNQLNLQVKITEDSENACILGAGKMLASGSMLKRILNEN